MTDTFLVVRKINKRLCIADAESGRVVYARPAFLDPVRDRDVMRDLAAAIEVAANSIVPITAHETAHNPRVRRALRTGMSFDEDPVAGPGPR